MISPGSQKSLKQPVMKIKCNLNQETKQSQNLYKLSLAEYREKVEKLFQNGKARDVWNS